MRTVAILMVSILAAVALLTEARATAFAKTDQDAATPRASR